MVLIESEQAQASDEQVLEDPRRNGGCNRFTRPRAKGGLPPAVRDALRRSRSVTGEGIRAPKGARPAARRDQHAQHRQPPQQPPGGYPQRRWTPARPRSPLPRRRLGCRSVWRDPASSWTATRSSSPAARRQPRCPRISALLRAGPSAQAPSAQGPQLLSVCAIFPCFFFSVEAPPTGSTWGSISRHPL